VPQWQDTQPSLRQALASIDPADYTEAQYGCHAYLLKTDANTYNLAFTTQKGVVETHTEQQQRTREVEKTREVQKTRTVYAPWYWWFFFMGWYSWEETYVDTETYWDTETYTVDVEVESVVSQDCEQLAAINAFIDSLSTGSHYNFTLNGSTTLMGTTNSVGDAYTQNPLGHRIVAFTSNDPANVNGQPIATSSLDEGPYNGDWMLFSNVSVTPNTAPTLSFIAPDGDTTINSSYTIEWIASDPDNQAVISLYYDTDNSGNDGTLIVNTLAEGIDNSYLWDASGIEGTYYLYAKIDDEVNSAVYHYADHALLTIDTVPPKLTMPTDLSVTVASVPTALDIGQATATDLSTPVTITDNAPAQFNVGTTMVAWTAVDNNGNSVTKSQAIVVELEPQAFPSVIRCE
jgi:hypothetical protein